jgi:hypothetical protein
LLFDILKAGGPIVRDRTNCARANEVIYSSCSLFENRVDVDFPSQIRSGHHVR